MASSPQTSAQDQQSTGSDLAHAADRLRESAKWLLASFAAVGVILAGGLQIADVGALSTDDPPRLVAAILGLAASIVGIILAISEAGKVVSSSSASLASLVEDKRLEPVREEIDQGKDGLLGNQKSVQDLRTNLHEASARASEAYEALVAARKARYAAPADRETAVVQATDDFTTADGNLKHLRTIRGNVLEVASYRAVLKSHEGARRRTAIAAGIAAGGIGLFAWGANPPDAIASGELLPKTPSEVTVIFSATSPRLLTRLGPDCDLTRVKAIALSVRGQDWTVATEDTPDCNAAWLTVRPEDGEVVARLPDLPPPPDAGSGLK